VLTGAQALLRTLVDAGVTTCFTNPGTSEMHFVAALDSVPEMRAILTLFEGVATGAADGYARMADKPAATLLHLGPGLGNGLANLHNARRAGVPVVNIVGDHATFHVKHDAPLQSDIETVARNVSSWVRTSARTRELSHDAVRAVAAAIGPPGQVATLIVPADVSWETGAEPAQPVPPGTVAPRVATVSSVGSRELVTVGTVPVLGVALREGPATALLLGGRALREDALLTAGRIAAATGAKLLAGVFPTRMRRGAGLPPVQRLAYLGEFASAQLADLKQLILVDAKPPVSFFGYPGKESYLVPEGCRVLELAAPAGDVAGSLLALADELGAADTAPLAEPTARPALPEGELTADTVCQAVGALLPANAILSDEAATSGMTLPAHTDGAPPHDVLTLTGGAIGQGLPVAVGAAVACPSRPVIALEADGSAMYTIQSLWTMAREQLDITVVIFSNRSYAILNMELDRVGAGQAGPRARAQLELTRPDLDFVGIGTGMGVPSVRVGTCEEFVQAFRRALDEPGPHLIEALVPSLFGTGS
jgi:acetolactate synthase-1/2/3 large subunit